MKKIKMLCGQGHSSPRRKPAGIALLLALVCLFSQASACPVFAAEEEQDAMLDGEMEGGMYITNNCAYGLYYFHLDGANAFIDTMNQVYANIGDRVNLYVMNVPQSACVMLDDDTMEMVGSSSEGEAIEYIYSGLDQGIHVIRAFDALKEHNDEYIYFHTDHHWTQLGAYYAYREFCREKGITPHELDEFQTETFAENSYLGTFYANSGQSPELAANPDTVYTYIPNGTNDMDMILQNGEYRNWKIICDAQTYEYHDTDTYLVFAGSDQPFAHAHNPNITDGSAILVVKDSYGNAFVPWLIDHYENVYWIDYRYAGNTVSQMIADYGIQDVLYECDTFNATSGRFNDAYLQIGQ